ncbi:translation initiation factor eIF-2B subunit delta [Angomonas deanei]|uniref:Translation initiation factor eIF2B subunit delta n=1 Tax=Angomonas deanei TaxID=59799 RepID=A0A7G2CBR4_9TRYP|nr:translation initiation factor eIF-2B subunit delta [Angomonas deanei]CAD2215492.1 Initiation factor 2 subunit family, putative [Angomonas deanei]|eukprot:EPY25297.1 translation initiation factor eIF-2B subunit delta [Angomonas deanei]
MSAPAESLRGQDTEESREAVKQQRELKRKKDALRKLEKKLKGLKPEDETYEAVVAEVKELTEFVKAAEEKQPPAQPDPAKKKKASPPKIEKKEEPAAEKVETEEEIQKNREALRKLMEEAIAKNTEAPSRITPKISVVHSRVAETGLLMEEMLIVGGNARAMSTLSAFRELVRETTTLDASDLKSADTTAFEKVVELNFMFLRRKRGETVGMTYVKDALVRRLMSIKDAVLHKQYNPLPDDEPPTARNIALFILNSIESEMELSLKSIVEDRSLPYVSSSDTILVFGRSSVVELILLSRARSRERRPKRVIVLDSAPLFEGKELANKLAEVNIDVTYGLLTSCCTLMSQCTRVFIGASAVLQNGDVFARCGTALVAACAKSFQKPVLCFAESYKFLAEVWVGNLGQNTKLGDMRLGNSEDPLNDASTRSPIVFSTPNDSPQPGGHASFGAHQLQLSTSASGYLYDLTPAVYVDMIICEMGCLHGSAIVAAIKDREERNSMLLW